jgi:tetratricopeptide (TPR) repeat protein
MSPSALLDGNRALTRLSILILLVLGGGVRLSSDATAKLTIDYPEDGSIFPPEFPPPTFLWHDSTRGAALWKIEVSFTDGSAAIQETSSGERLRIGKIDPDCVADTNEPPKLTPKEAAAHTWIPSAAVWAAIRRHSTSGPATVTISGLGTSNPVRRISSGQIRIRTARDPVGAPIFYRDVPLMPSEAERGVIKPLAASAVPLVAWRLRNVTELTSRVVLENLPVCANCHSFSADGKTMGMDLDGLESNRGLYILTQVKRQMEIADRDVIQWSTARGALKGRVRVGFMSQVSPDGRFVATTIDPLQSEGFRDAPSNYYVANFKDYRFLQVFYPTRGILSWYSKATGILQPLPGADDPRFVQMGGVWSPDGQYLVFARAKAKDASAPGLPLAQFANDPVELPMQYDLYRIPFRDGKGGQPEAIVGASGNGVSNSFPKVSPDGRWIVFVKSRNGLLMRPDSRLYIVPAGGGYARLMRCNTALMNSWHSFSPNGRWLVFSSKARSPYTQMYLTHIDEDGNDSPAILIENATAANRAVNLPEFVNIAPDGLREIGGAALDYYKVVNSAVYLQKRGQLTESIAMWRRALELKPQDALSHNNLGTVLLMTGNRTEAGVHFQQAAELKLRTAVADNPGDATAYHKLGRMLLDQKRLEEAAANLRDATALDPASAAIHCDLGVVLLRQGRTDDSLTELRRTLALDSRFAPAHYNLGLILERRGEADEAVKQWQAALDIDPQYAEVYDHLADTLYRRGEFAAALVHWRKGSMDPVALRQMAWMLATCPDASVRDGREATALAVRALQLSGQKNALVWDALAAAYAEAGQFAHALMAAQRALGLAQENDKQNLAEAIQDRIRLYKTETAFRETADSIRPSGHGSHPR